jgi:hypothetical protein
MLMVCGLWWLTRTEDAETRRIGALRRHIGKTENKVIEEDVTIGDKLDQILHRNDKKQD